MEKIHWVSRHPLSPGQRQAILNLHGDVEIIHDPVTFDGMTGLADYISQHSDSFVYAVATAAHYLYAASKTLEFGVFENHPARRLDGQFGLSAVYHCRNYWRQNPASYTDGAGAVVSEIERVWENSDPNSDQGDTLIPIQR